jgi:hypothetical protein
VPLARDSVELAATEIFAFTIALRDIAMMMAMRRLGHGVIVRLAIMVVMLSRATGMRQRLGKRFNRAINRSAEKNQRQGCSEKFPNDVFQSLFHLYASKSRLLKIDDNPVKSTETDGQRQVSIAKVCIDI